MATDPKASLSPNRSPEPLPPEVEQALASGLGPYTLPERLGWLLSSLGVAERQAYLKRIGQDKPNGCYERASAISVRPAGPAAYQRGYPEDTEALLLSLRASPVPSTKSGTPCRK